MAEHDRRTASYAAQASVHSARGGGETNAVALGKQTLVQRLAQPAPAPQTDGASTTSLDMAANAGATAAHGTAGAGYPLAPAGTMQGLFGHRGHVGLASTSSTRGAVVQRAPAATAGGAVASHAEAAVPPNGMWEHTFGEASTPVGKFGRVQAPKGVYLRSRPLPGTESHGAPVPFNGMVHIERRTTQGHANERWCYVIATDAGTAGFCEERYLAIDPPEPTATLRRTAPGERLAVIASEAFGAPTDENNSRLQVQVLYLANRDRIGVKLDHVELGFKDRTSRDDDKEQTLKVYKGAKVLEGTSLWIPSKPFLEQLKAAGSVTDGSTYATEAWDKAKGVVGGAVDGAKYVGGFMVGILEGAYNAIVDLFKGAADVIEAVLKAVWNLVTNNLGAIKDMLMGWVDKMKLVWEHRGEIADEFLQKWNAQSMWDRGQFQGDVLGWIMMTVLLILVTMGEDAPAAVAGIVARWPQIVKLLKTVDTLGDVTTYLGAAAKAVKVPGKAASYAAEKLGRASRGAEHLAEDVTRAGRKTTDVAEHASTHMAEDLHSVDLAPGSRHGPGAAHTHDESFSANRTFERSEKHSGKDRKVGGKKVAKEPTDGQAALDFSFQASSNSPRRIGIDVRHNEFVVFDRTGNKVVNKEVAGGIFHGHVRSWEELDAPMKRLLEERGLVKNGKISVDPARWVIP